MLKIKDLKVKIEEKEIIKTLNLDVKAGEVHAIMGPNGSGKSTLAKAIVGYPGYEITSGEVFLNNEDMTDLDADEKALKGLFMGFQYPVEIPGVNNESFLRMAYNAKQKHMGKPEVDPIEFDEILQKELKALNASEEFLTRSINQGFSGGEKKRNEMLQLRILDPKVAILDETDSGLDIDALKEISQSINEFKSKEKAIILITHYQRLLNFIVPDRVHVMKGGKIVESGDKALALKLEEQGYDWI